ncbi:MAG: sugar phosphate isomerase/epimerase [Phycisphaerae bacterium]
MIQLAFSTNAYTRHGLAEACERIAAAGYRAVEILADVPHAYPGAELARTGKRLAERVRSLGLAAVAMNANTLMGYWTPVPTKLTFEPSLITRDDAQRNGRILLIEAVMAHAHAFGAPVVTITTGQPLSGESPEVLRKRFLAGLDRLVHAADITGIELAIEPEPGQFIETSRALKELLDEVDHPRLGANLDIGHVACMGEDPAESVRLLGPHLKHLHLEDIKGRRHWHLIPGLGDMDFAGVRRALDEVGYSRAAAVELYTYAGEPDRAAREAFAALSPLFGE